VKNQKSKPLFSNENELHSIQSFLGSYAGTFKTMLLQWIIRRSLKPKKFRTVLCSFKKDLQNCRHKEIFLKSSKLYDTIGESMSEETEDNR